LTEATMISLVGGAIGLWFSVVLLSWVSTWQPFPQFPINLPVRPDVNVFLFALLLAMISAFLFGATPVWQGVRTHPYLIIQFGSWPTRKRRIAGRDLLVVLQIAICALLITSSMVAVRGLVRSLHSRLGFEPQNATLMETELRPEGYSDDSLPAMQQRMIEAVEA